MDAENILIFWIKRFLIFKKLGRRKVELKIFSFQMLALIFLFFIECCIPHPSSSTFKKDNSKE